MSTLTRDIFDRLTAPGPRLPWLREWLLEEVWTLTLYEGRGPQEFLERGERMVSDLEEVMAAAAPRIYDELAADPPPQRDLRAFLERERPCAAVVFDGLSLREVPLILNLAGQGGFDVREVDVATAAVPSDTMAFVEQRLRAGPVAPSDLGRRRELKEAGIEAFYYNQEGARHLLAPEAQALCLWSAFPDQTYQDSGARFVNHFVEIHDRLEAAWRNTVQALSGRRKILITSDHGYIFFGHGCSAPRDNQAIRPLTEWLRGERWRSLADGEDAPAHPDLAVIAHRRVAMIRGRVQTHPPGPASARLYKHGGLSLMEMLTPWIILEPARGESDPRR